MKKLLTMILIVACVLLLSSCFESTSYPDMVEYTKEEVLSTAQEKYGITAWIFTEQAIHGEAIRDHEGVLTVSNHDTQFTTKFVNGENTDTAITAFAGKNGGHDIQGKYANFLCYVALGQCADGSLKFVYYNTNIHKDAHLADTIGASDYVLEVLPTEITHEVFQVDPRWTGMGSYIHKHFNHLDPKGFIYSENRLIIRYSENYGDFAEAEFYKENGKVVFDLYFFDVMDMEIGSQTTRKLVYSTSERYGVIYNYDGLDKAQYLDITYTVEQSTDDQNCMLLRGYAKLREVPGEILYSLISYRAEYDILRDGKVIRYESGNTAKCDSEISPGYLMDKIEGVDHTQTANFTIPNFYIFYEKY